MSNSAWTETGASISLVPTTSTIDAGSSATNVNYLTNSYKIALMSQYSAELAMKTSLDTLASTLSVSATAYNSAVAAINTTITGFSGAPSNWATIWPDGTTSGPWVGIQTLLSTDWAAIATQRTALQSAISAAQAAAAQAAAISSAVATATANAPAVVNGLPTLPNATYPANRLVYDTVTTALYMSTGSAWQSATVTAGNIQGIISAAQIAGVAASQVTGQLTAAQIASIAAVQLTGAVGSGNLCVNGDFMLSTSGTPSGYNVYDNGGTSITSTVAAGGAIGTANYWRLTANAAITNTFGFYFGSAASLFGGWQASTNYVVSFYARISTNPSSATMATSWNHIPAIDTWLQNPVLTASWQRYAILVNFGTNAIDAQGFFSVSSNSAPSGAKLDFSCLQVQQGDALSGWAPPGVTAANPITPLNAATYIGANSITTGQIAANTITAGCIAAGAIGATQIAANSITAAQIAAGAITAEQIAANTITAGCIAAGAIGATQIAANSITATQISSAYEYTGTLNASQITAGEITATTIYFTDGFCLNTLEPAEAGADATLRHILTATASPSGNIFASATSPATDTIITGMGFSVTAASASDVFNMMGSVIGNQYAGTTGVETFIRLYVDGTVALSQPLYFRGGGNNDTLPFVMSLTGLSAGAHTFQFYAGFTSVDSTTRIEYLSSTYALCQRIY